MIQIEIACDTTTSAEEQRRLEEAICAILVDSNMAQAEISLAIVDDPTIHALNRQFLEHDYATDVLSFVLHHEDAISEGAELEGEIIVSRDTAGRVAPTYGWTAAEELLLYVIHGALHLVGYDDRTVDGADEMRRQEAIYLKRVGVSPGGVAARESTPHRLAPSDAHDESACLQSAERVVLESDLAQGEQSK